MWSSIHVFLKYGMVISPKILFLLRIDLGIRVLGGPNEFYDSFFPHFCEESEILISFASNLLIALGIMVFGTLLILEIHESGKSFHFLVSFSISFLRNVKFFYCRSLSSTWLGLFPDSFFVFDAIVHESVLLMSFSVLVISVQKGY